MAETEQQAKSETQKQVAREKVPEIGPGLGVGDLSAGLDMAMVRRTLADPPSAPPEGILQLQRAVGNQSVLRLTGRSQTPETPSRPLYAVQTKLMVGSPYDNYEQEADRVASQVMSMATPSPAAVQRYAITPLSQRQLWRHPGLQRLIQAKGDGSFEAGDDFEQRLGRSKGSGSPLPEPTRNFMEERFGADFSGVRIHTGSEAVQMNRDVSAQAFTHGSDIYFGAGKFSPDTDSGKHLLAHELTHTIQQSGGGLQTQRLIQRQETIQDLLYAQLAIPTSGGGLKSGLKSGLSSLGSGVVSGVKKGVVIGVGALGMEAMRLLAQYSGLGDQMETVRSAQYYLGLLKAGYDLAKAAYNMWNSIPPHFKSLIAYVTGSLCYMAAKRLPYWLGGSDNPKVPGFLITYDVDKESMAAGITYLGEVQEAVLSQVDKEKVDEEDEEDDPPAVMHIDPPKSSLLEQPPDLVSQESDQSGQESSGVSGLKSEMPKVSEESSVSPSESAPKKAPIASLKLPYFKLDLLEMNTRQQEEDSERPGGLFIKGGVEFDIMGIQLGKGDQELTAAVTLPWGLNQTPQVDVEAKNIGFKGFSAFGNFLNVSGIMIKRVKIGNEGLTDAHFKIDQVSVAGGKAVASNLEAQWSKEGLTFSGGSLNLDLFGFKLGATGFELKLDENGQFVKAGIDSVSVGETETLKIQKILLAKQGAGDLKLTIDEAKIKLPDALKNGESNPELTFSQIAIDKTGVTGAAAAGPFDINLIQDRLAIEKASIKGAIGPDGWSVNVKGGVNVKGESGMQSASGSGKSLASGKFDITYARQKGAGTFTGGVQDGRFDFTLGNIAKFTAEGIDYKIDTKTLRVPSAGVDLLLNRVPGLESAGIIETTGKEFVLGPSGFDFESIAINYVDSMSKLPKPIQLFEGVTLENIGAEINKKGPDYRVEAHTDLKVNFPEAKVSGGVQGAQVVFDSTKGVSGSFNALELKTAWFKLLVTGGQLTPEGLHIDSAALIRESQEESGARRPTQTYGLQQDEMNKFGQFPVTSELKFQANDIWIKRGEGLTVGSVETTLKKLGFNMFGVAGGVDFDAKSAFLKGGVSFPPKTMPGWPVRMDVFYPIVPPGGIDLTGYIAAGGGLTAGVDMEAGVTPKEDEDGAWQLGFKGGPNFSGELYGEAGVGVYFGSSVLIAVGTDLFLRFPLRINAGSTVEGGVVFRPHAKERKFAPTPDFAIKYNTEAEAKAQIGMRLNVKFLYFFNKTLYTIRFKEWVLGSFKFGGKLGVDAEGHLKAERDAMQWQFMGKSGGRPAGPSVDSTIVELQEVDTLAAKAGLRIAQAEKHKVTAMDKVKSQSLTKKNKVESEETEKIEALRTKYTDQIIVQYKKSEKAATAKIRKLETRLEELTVEKAKHTRTKMPTEREQLKLLEELEALKVEARESKEARDKLNSMKETHGSNPAYKYFEKLKEYEDKLALKTAQRDSIREQLGGITEVTQAERQQQKEMVGGKINTALVKARTDLEEQEKNKTSWLDKLVSIKDVFKKIKNVFKKKDKQMIPEDEFVTGLQQEKAEGLESGVETESLDEQQEKLQVWKQTQEETSTL